MVTKKNLFVCDLHDLSRKFITLHFFGRKFSQNLKNGHKKMSKIEILKNF